MTWEAAWGYAGWWSDQTGVTWRLPTELEWEKAARGVDGRQYPWGNHTDPNWCCVGVSHPDRPQVASVNSFPQDRSIYGIRGLGGNVRDWCIGHLAEKAGPDTPEFQRVLRGGHWVGPAWLARSCLREVACRPAEDTVGFRLVHVPTADGTRS